MITPDLVRRFLQGTCTEEEKALLKAYFTRYPEAWDRYLTLEEWETFEPEQPEQEKTERWWKKIRQQTAPKRTWQKLAVAASITLLAAAGWTILVKNPKKESPAPRIAETLKRQFNGGKTTQRFYMEDGSTVDLQPGSDIRYQEPFAKGGRRIIYLDGAASFEAATDAKNPMQVYSGALVTTVLGTSFTIQAYEQSPYIKVVLRTGKIKVADIVMRPGEELWYNKQSMLASIKKAPRRKDAEAPPRIPDWYMFNNQSLAQVFDQLSEIYDVRIQYTESDLRGLYFIAKFEKTDSLEEIMRDIAVLNGLTIRKLDNTYIVKRKSH